MWCVPFEGRMSTAKGGRTGVMMLSDLLVSLHSMGL